MKIQGLFPYKNILETKMQVNTIDSVISLCAYCLKLTDDLQEKTPQ